MRLPTLAVINHPPQYEYQCATPDCPFTLQGHTDAGHPAPWLHQAIQHHITTTGHTVITQTTTRIADYMPKEQAKHELRNQR